MTSLKEIQRQARISHERSLARRQQPRRNERPLWRSCVAAVLIIAALAIAVPALIGAYSGLAAVILVIVAVSVGIGVETDVS